MKRSTKTISIILVFFLIIAIVIIGRTMVGNHFKKKFSKRPPPGINVTKVVKKEFSEKIETFGTAISKKSKTFKIKKDDTFLFGRESAGVPKNIHHKVDKRIKIPILKKKRSLNLSTTVSMVVSKLIL